MECPRMSPFRKSCGIGSFIQAYKCIRPHLSSLKLYSLYLNDSYPESMKDKAIDLYHMYLGWRDLMNIDI